MTFRPIRPIPAGTLCTLAGATVRAYARICPGVEWDDTYDCYRTGEPRSPESWVPATREQLAVVTFADAARPCECVRWCGLADCLSAWNCRLAVRR